MQDKDCGSKICRPVDVTNPDGEKECVGKATLKGPCRIDADCRGAAYCDKPSDAPADEFSGTCKANKLSTPARPPKKKKSTLVKKVLAECSGKSAKSCMSDSKQKKKPHCFLVKEVTKKQGRKVPTDCINVLNGFDGYKRKLEDTLNDLNADLNNIIDVADKDRPAVHQLLSNQQSNTFHDHEYEYVLLLLSNRYGNDIATWLHDALDEDNEIKTFHGFSNKRKVFVLFNLLEMLRVEVAKIKSMMANKKKGEKSKYVAFTMHFPHFFRYKYKYVDQGYTPDAGFRPNTKGVCIISETVDLNRRTYLPKCKTTTICNVLDSVSGGKTYSIQDAEYQQEELYIMPQKSRGNMRVGGKEDFTTPTKYMSFMNVYKYEMTNGHLMTKVPTVLKTIEALDARDLSSNRGYQRHCIFTQTNMIMNMLPYFIANGYFIPNRLPSPRDADDYEWFLLARNATVRRKNDGMLEIQWPKKSESGYYVPENVTTIEPSENFLIRDCEGNSVSVTRECCHVNLYAPYHKRIVYLYSDKVGKDIIGNTNMYVNNGHKKEFTKNFFNNDLQSAHIIIIDQTQKEGLSLFDVAYMHINEVITNIGDYEQATARVARRCKSQRLPTIRFSEFNLRFVSVFMYDSTFPSQECYLKDAVDPNDNSQKYYKEWHNEKCYVRSRDGALMCRAIVKEDHTVVFPSDSVLNLVDQILTQFTFSDKQKRRIRGSLTVSFDSFYRALADRHDFTNIITAMNEWMKRYSFDYSQKKALEELDLQNIIQDDFRLANQAYKDTFLRKSTPDFVVPNFNLPDYTNIQPYKGTLTFMYTPLFAFIFKRLKLLFPNELKILSFPGGNIQNELIWEATIFLANKSPPALGTSKLTNTRVVKEAVEALLNDNSGLRYLVVSMSLNSTGEYKSNSNHQNALIFYKEALGDGKFKFTVERFEPNGFDDEQFRPALLNLEMEKMLSSLKTHLYEAYKPVVVDFTYVTPLDQCAFNLNFSTLTASGYCVPWSVFYLDYRLMNPQADATELIEFIRQQWQNTELHKSFIESYTSAALQFFDDLNAEMTKQYRKQGNTISTIYRQFITLSETAQEELINAIMGDQSLLGGWRKQSKKKMIQNVSLTSKEFKKMQVMGYKELRPREIEQKPSLLDKYIGWYASEKIDGWQAIWDGKGTLYTKTYKRTFAVPDRWIKLLPKIPMAGEIKIKGQPATKTATLMKDNPLWNKTYFHVFDVVGKNHINKPFCERVNIIKKLVKDACKNIPKCPLIAAPQIVMKSRKEILAFYKKVLKNGGEGLVITAPDSTYDTGKKRSNQRVKLKGRNDAEGKVIGYKMGDENKLKSLNVKFNKITFQLGIGFKNFHRVNPKKYFPLGTMVTFSYRELNENGKPKEARFVAVRGDI